MATQLEVIQKFMTFFDKSKLSGEGALDKAIRSVGLGSFSSLKESFMSDLRGASNTSVPHLEGETAEEYFLRVYCGIDFKTADSGAITGSDAGGSKTKTDDNIIAESGSLKTTFKDNSFTVENLNVTLADKKTFSDLTDKQQFIWQGLNTWWVKGALDLVKESYGDNFSFVDKAYARANKLKTVSSATTNELYIKFINDADEDKISVDPTYDESTGETTSITLTINTAYYKSLDTATANSEFDRTIAHEMTHVVMMANLFYLPLYRSLPGFITEGLAELTIGITNSNADSIKALAADVTKYDVGLDANDLARDESFMYEGGYTFFRYLARQAGDLTIANSSTPNTLLLTFYGDDTIESSANNVTIQSGYGDDSIKASGKKLAINSDGGNNSIYLSKNSTNNKITTGKGKDTVFIAANTSKHTVSTGAGNDSIDSGSDIALIDAGAGNDYISNRGSVVSINAGAGNDSINNGAERVLINGDDGNDYVSLLSTAANNTLNGGKGSDYVYIYTNSKNHNVDMGDGNDTIHSEGSNIFVDTGDGKDVVQLYAGDSTAENNTINSGKGNDSIYSGGTNISVNADDGDDYIHVYSYANDITIKPGTGNDTIESYCESGFLYQYASGDGDDSIKGFSEKDTLSITAGSYSTTKSGSDIIVTVDENKITLEGAATLSTLNIGTLSGGAATLTVTNSTSSPVTVGSSVKVIDASSRTTAVKIKGNGSANTIYGGSGSDSIFGGSDNDKLYGQAGKDTLNGGMGNDTLTGGKGSDLFISKSGKNVITDYETGDRISLGAALTDTTLKGSDVVFTMGDNSLTVKNAKGKKLSMSNSAGKSFTTIIGGSNPLEIANSKSNTLISGTSGNDSIYNSGYDVTINAGAGNDYIENDGDRKVSIDGGAGDDSILVYNSYGGSSSKNITIKGGTGKDLISIGGANDLSNLIQYKSGDGNDTIYGFNSTSTLSISGGSYSTQLSGYDVLVKVGNGTITLKDAYVNADALHINSNDIPFVNKAFTLSSSNNSITVSRSSISIIGGAEDDTISNYGKSVTISSGAGDDYISNINAASVSIAGGSGKDSIRNSGANVTIIGGDGKDLISLGSYANNNLIKYKPGDGSDTICGFKANSTLSISGGSYSTQASGYDVLVKVGSDTIRLKNAYALADTIHINKKSTSLKRKAIELTSSNNDIVAFRNSISIVGSSGNDKIESHGSKVTLIGNAGNDSICNYGSRVTLTGGAGDDSIDNRGNNVSLNAGTGNDSIYNTGANVTIKGGEGNDLISLGTYADNNLIKYKSGDGNDLIYGFNSTSTLSIAGSSYSTKKSGDNIIVTAGKGKITLKGAATLSTLNIGTLSGGSATLTVTNSTSSPVTVGSSVKVIDASSRTTAVKIKGNGSANTIYGGSGSDSIFGGSGNDRLYGQAGKDTLNGGMGNDTLTGGKGSDLFISKSGKNVITDYETGDRISLGAALTNTTLKGSDVVFTMGDNSLTVKNAKGKSLAMINSAGKSYSTVVGNSGNSTTLTVTDSTSSPVTVSSSVKVIDASSRTLAVSIKGNGSDNTILGGTGNDSLYGRAGNDSIYGYAGNDKLYGSNGDDILFGGSGYDTLWGDAGDDSLYGGTGNDTFIYTAGEGTDKIFDYQSGDVLKILNGSFSNSAYSNGTLTLTIKGGGSVLLENVTTSTTFNINNKSYKISGSKLK